MDSQQQVINQVKKEFEAHRHTSVFAPFTPSPEGSAALAKVVRGLESRRQLGELTTQETHWLRDIDQLLEDIANYNRVKTQKPNYAAATGAYQNLVYDLQGGAPKEEEALTGQAPAVIPRITSEEADQIISIINQQFEEKVLKKLKNRPVDLPAPAAEPSDFAVGDESVSGGRNLQDYLTVVRAERPVEPFADEDSNMDSSKLKTRVL